MDSKNSFSKVSIVKIKGIGTALKGFEKLFTQAEEKKLKEEDLVEFVLDGLKKLNTLSQKDENLLREAIPHKYKRYLNGQPLSSEDKKPFVDIRLLGSSNNAYMQLEKEAMDAVVELDVEGPFRQIRDQDEIAEYGMHPIPALVINGKVVSAGRIIRKDEIKKLILDEIQKSTD
jgi:hypothetical protein